MKVDNPGPKNIKGDNYLCGWGYLTKISSLCLINVVFKMINLALSLISLYSNIVVSRLDKGNSSSTTSSIDLKNAPMLHLADTWIRTDNTAFQCVCDVQKVCKVSLKCVCTVCGGVIVEENCPNIACDNQEAYKFTSRAR